MGNSAVMDALVEEIEARLAAKHTTPSGTPTTNYMHGPGGIFGVSGLERDVLSTRVHPRSLLGSLPAMGSMVMNPLYPYLTGFQAGSGDNPDGVCDDGPVAGPTKSCIQTAQYGRYTQMTKEIEVDRVGQQTDRGEFMDLRVLNDPLLANMGGVLDQSISGSPNLRREVLQAFVEVGVAFQNQLVPQLYTGNPANNSAGGGYAEFPGLDILIGTNKVDAITGTECPSLDSDIKNFNYGLVDEVGNSDIVEALTYMYRWVRSNAARMNMNPATWAITMRDELFYELTAVWPCSYLTYRCAFRAAGNAQERVNVDAGDQIAMRDSMRQGSYLLIDGAQVPVILDDGIVEETDADNAAILAGQFASDIYVIPMTIMGGTPVTFMQYLDYQRGAMEAVEDGRVTSHFWTDGGRYLWHSKPPLNWCNQWIAKIEPRVILRTPHLAGRLTNVRYAPLQHTRSPFPDDPYFADGGETSRTGPSYYSDWNLPD
jgi:hypothetical protein